MDKSTDNFAIFFVFLYFCTMKKILLSFCILQIIALTHLWAVRPFVWVLDAGHGGHDRGTAVNGVLEKDLTLQITKELEKLIRQNKPGIKLILTRKTDKYLSLEERCRIANRANADLFLSIHVNYVRRKPYMKGTETFYANLRASSNIVRGGSLLRSTEKSELLAWLIQKNYYEQGRPCERGAKKGRYYVLLNTDMPAALTEVGFLSNKEDAAYMTSKKGQREIALNLYNALNEYYTTTKAKTQRNTLLQLRRSSGTYSGLKVKKLKSPYAEDKDKPKILVEEKDVKKTKPEVVEPSKVEEPKVDGKNDVVENPVKAEATTPEKSDSVISEAAKVPVYSIQIVAVSSELKSNDARLKGLSPVTFVRSGNMFKGLYGGTTDYKQAQKTLSSIRAKFPDAFIVAYLGEKSIPTAEALKLSR